MISAEDLIQENQESNAMRLGTVAALFAHGTAKVQFDGEDSPSEKEYAYLSYYTPQVNDRVLLSKFGKTYVILGALSYAVAPPIIDEGNNYLFDEAEVVMTKGLDVTGSTKLKSGLAVTGNISGTGSVTATDGDVSGMLRVGSLTTNEAAATSDTIRTGTLNTTNVSSTNVTATTFTGYGNSSISTLTVSNTFRHTGGSLGFFNAAAQTKKWVTWNNQTDSQKLNNLAYALRDYGLITLN